METTADQPRGSDDADRASATTSAERSDSSAVVPTAHPTPTARPQPSEQSTTTEHSSTTERSPTDDRRLGGHAPVSDLLALASVPAVLWVVYALPPEMRLGLALDHANPSLVGMFASHYVHLSGWHLASNLGLYLMVGPLSYLLCAIAGRKRAFRLSLFTYLLVFPWVLSGLNVALARPTVGVGFSGIGMAFVGLLPWALFAYLHDRLPATFSTQRAPVLFFLGAVVIGSIVMPPTPLTMAGVAVATLGLVAYVGALVFGRSPELPGRLSNAIETPGYVEIAGISLVVFVGVAVMTFSAPPVQEGTVVNQYSHFLGYCLGFIVPYTMFDALEL
ncbi:hypothetical protein [Haloarchaeobius sp. DFWS5]|uniref:hypothetical protein n=1 Tax=Haloarchaeobius sp. DFWS5 TaxID=3446114 RepID=UPI003EB83AA4